jgi:hypothetical protein
MKEENIRPEELMLDNKSNQMDYQTMIRNIQADIFAYNVGELPGKVTGLFEQVLASDLLCNLNAGEMQRFNKMFEACLHSLQDKDYLRLADTLEYEIGPLIALTLN